MNKFTIIIFLIFSSTAKTQNIDSYYDQYFNWINDIPNRLDSVLGQMQYCALSMQEDNILTKDLCQAVAIDDPLESNRLLKKACGKIRHETESQMFELGKRYLSSDGKLADISRDFRKSLKGYLHDYLNPDNIKNTIIESGESPELANDCVSQIKGWRSDKLYKYLLLNEDNNFLRDSFINDSERLLIQRSNDQYNEEDDDFMASLVLRINESVINDNKELSSLNESIKKCSDEMEIKPWTTEFTLDFYGAKTECKKYRGNFCRQILKNLYRLGANTSRGSLESIYTKENIGKLNIMMDNMKEEFSDYAKKMDCVSDDYRLKMLERIKNTKIKQINSLDYQKISASCKFSACCMDTHTTHPKIFFPPHYITLMNNGFEKSIEATMMHEMAHAMAGGYDKDQSKFLKCKGHRGLCIKRKYHLGKYEKLTASKKNIFFEEAFADDVANDILDNRLRKATGENKKEIFEGILAKACTQVGKDNTYDKWESDHPLDADRAKFLLKKPAVIKAMGCENRFEIKPNISCGPFIKEYRINE